MATDRAERILDNLTNGGQGDLLGVQTNPTDILLEEVARLVQSSEIGKYNPLKLMLLQKLAHALMTHGAPITKVTAEIRGFVAGLVLRSGEAQELTHEIERVHGILDGIMQRHESELADVRQQLTDAQNAGCRMVADHQVELDRVRARLEGEMSKLTTRIDEIIKTDSGKSVDRLLADKTALQERLQHALDDLKEARRELRAPSKDGKATTSNDQDKVDALPMDDATNDADEARKKLKASEAKYHRQSLQLGVAETNAKRYKADFERTEAQLKLAQEEFERFSKLTPIGTVVNGSSDHTAELNGLRSQVADLTRQLKVIHASFVMPIEVVGTAQNKVRNGEVNELKENVSRLTRELAEAEADASRKTTQLKRLLSQPPATRLDPRDKKLKVERDQLHKDKEALEKEAGRLNKTIDSMNTRLVTLSNLDSDSEERLVNLRRERDVANQRAVELTERVAELETVLTERDSETLIQIDKLDRRLTSDKAEMDARLGQLGRRIKEISSANSLSRSRPTDTPTKVRAMARGKDPLQEGFDLAPKPAFFAGIRGAQLFDEFFRGKAPIRSLFKAAEKPREEFVRTVRKEWGVMGTSQAGVFYDILHTLLVWGDKGAFSEELAMTRIASIRNTFR